MSRFTNTDYRSYSHQTASSYTSSGRPLSRPPSEELCDIHVYRVPHELWRDSFNNILNNSVTETISIGIIRVPYELRLVDIREEIVQQLQLDDLLPRDFVFLRSVGRSLTTLRGKQEYQLKAKHFIPPVAYSPEMYILEVTPEIRDALAISDGSIHSPVSRRASPTHRSYNNSYRNGYPGGSDPDRGSHPPPRQPASPSSFSVQKYEPLPQIPDSGPQEVSPEVPNSHSNSNSNFYPNHLNSSYRDQSTNTPYKDQPNTNLTYRTLAPQTNGAYDDNTHEDRQTDNENDWGQGPVTSQTAITPQAAQMVKSDPPRSADKGSNRRHDDDSGVAELSPDDEYNRRGREDRDSRMPQELDSNTFAVDELSDAERRQRLEEIENMNELDRQRWTNDQDGRRRQAEEDRRRAEEELRHKEEQDRRMRESEERRQKEENERREREQRKRLEDEEERRRKEEEENQRNKYKDDMARFPSPPPLQMSSPEPDPAQSNPETARQRREERDRLMRELEQARTERQMQEREREECVKKAKTMQHKTTNRRNEARDMWKKKYFEEKKKTAPLEENSNRLRQELEALHRRLMNTLEGPKDRGMKTVDAKPSEKNNYVIQCTKLQHEIEDIQRRVENAKMKLTAEMKLRNQAEGELRALRADLTQKTTNMTLARQQQYAALVPRVKQGGSPQRLQQNDRSRIPDSSASDSSRILRAF